MRSFKASAAPPSECPPASVPPSAFQGLSSFLFSVLIIRRSLPPSRPLPPLPLVRSPMGTSCQAELGYPGENSLQMPPPRFPLHGKDKTASAEWPCRWKRHPAGHPAPAPRGSPSGRVPGAAASLWDHQPILFVLLLPAGPS